MQAGEGNVVHAILDRRAEGPWANLPVFVQDGRRFSFGEVHRHVGGLAWRLRDLGVRPQDRVLVCVENPLDFILGFLATLRLGGVALLFGARFQDASTTDYLASLGARLALVDQANIPNLPAGLPYLCPVTGVAGDSGWSSLASSTIPPCSPVDPDAERFHLYSSGTTGVPKCAVLSQRAFDMDFQLGFLQLIGAGPGVPVLTASPIIFAMSITVSGVLVPQAGGTAVLCPRLSPQVLRQTIAAAAPQAMLGLPATFAALTQLEKASPTGALASLRHSVCSGEPLPRRVAEQWRQVTGVPLVEVIGSAETLTTYVINDPVEPRLGLSGRPGPAFRLRLVDDAGQEVPPGEVGEVALWRWRHAFLGYWTDGRLEAPGIKDGWFRTGDLMRGEPDGFLGYAGRKDHAAKVGGCWVYPEELEKALLGHEAVREAVVFVLIPEGRPAVVVACVAGESEEAALATGARRIIRDRARVPGAGVRVLAFHGGTLPRGATGKTDRVLLRRMALEKLA
jgi:benzoate-CoA ligase